MKTLRHVGAGKTKLYVGQSCPRVCSPTWFPQQPECYHTLQSIGLGIRRPGLTALRNSLDLIHNMRVRSEGLYVKFSSKFYNFDTQGFPKIMIFFKNDSEQFSGGSHSKCPSQIQTHCPTLIPNFPTESHYHLQTHALKTLGRVCVLRNFTKVKEIYSGPVIKYNILHISFQYKQSIQLPVQSCETPSCWPLKNIRRSSLIRLLYNQASTVRSQPVRGIQPADKSSTN